MNLAAMGVFPACGEKTHSGRAAANYAFTSALPVELSWRLGSVPGPLVDEQERASLVIAAGRSEGSPTIARANRPQTAGEHRERLEQ